MPLAGKPQKLQALRNRDGVGTCTLPRPVPNDTIGFMLVGVDERCKEAQLTPLRRLMHEERQRRGLVVSPTSPTYPTERECYECRWA